MCGCSTACDACKTAAKAPAQSAQFSARPDRLNNKPALTRRHTEQTAHRRVQWCTEVWALGLCGRSVRVVAGLTREVPAFAGL